jgi:hypothetical protein
MPIELTTQQQTVLDGTSEAPVRVIDPRSNTAYVLLPLADYVTLRDLSEELRVQAAIEDVALRNAVGRMDGDE